MKGKTHQERAEIRDAMVAYKLEGHTAKEVAEAFGYTEGYAQYVCRGIAPQKGYGHKPNRTYRNQYTAGGFDREANAKRYIDERTPGFEYAGNYTGIDGYVDLRCRACGSVIRRSMVTVRHGKAKCDVCARMARERMEAERLTETEQRQRDAQNKKLAKAKQICLGVCGVCGALFIQKHGNQKYCSGVCLKKVNNAVQKDRRVSRIKGVIDDRTITLEKVYEKSRGVCALCGRQCSFEDYTVRDDGTFIAGNDYPSIDHIIPLSKGGRHAWGNVQLACRICNSRKSDKICPP